MVNTNEPKLTHLQNRIFRFLSVFADIDFNQRELAKRLKVSPPAIKKSLPKLKKEKLINTSKDTSGRVVIELNRENPKTIQFKRADNLKKIYESNFSDYLEETFPGTTIVLFGSYAYGEDTTKSDIDISIVGTKEKQIYLKKFEKYFQREIRINFYENWKEIHKDLRDNILNGIVLSGGIEL